MQSPVEIQYSYNQLEETENLSQILKQYFCGLLDRREYEKGS